MNTAQRRLLEAIDALQRERRGPVPDWLIPVAVNVIGSAERDALVKRVKVLIADGLLTEVRNHALDAGIEVTAEGRRALARTEPEPQSLPATLEIDGVPHGQGVPENWRENSIDLLVQFAALSLERYHSLPDSRQTRHEKLRLYELLMRFKEHLDDCSEIWHEWCEDDA